jgi:hypothetical protein
MHHGLNVLPGDADFRTVAQVEPRLQQERIDGGG